MSVHFPHLATDPALAAALDRAVAELNKMSPEDKRAMFAAQRKSWVIGEMMLAHPEMTRERAEELYQEACP